MVKKWLTALIVLAISAGPLTAIDDSRGADLIGQVTITDGDTLRLGGVRIRLHGIDAPEMDQTCRTEQGVTWPCGRYVATSLAAWIGNSVVACRQTDTDNYGRTVATCSIAGEDIGAWLVENGLALAYRKYSLDYVAAERRAASADLGLWSGSVQVPASYRLAAQASEAPPNPACAIKGNVSKGGKIYHLPGSKWYNKTKIDTKRGERWFCTVDEALRAGWRAPRG
ncbi:MAG: thermonuclease family protein [Rhodobacteraceae bacterium]|nr:thermonuclease family protein [Paracoccaceae bacterium]